MIEHQERYEGFIKDNGVGSNDKVADSVKSYISYLNSVGKHLNVIVGPSILSNEHDKQNLTLKLKLKKVVSDHTIDNYKSAMAQYISMVEKYSLK